MKPRLRYYGKVAGELVALGFEARERRQINSAAQPAAALAGYDCAWDWLERDHPARVNLILEQLGRPERIAERLCPISLFRTTSQSRKCRLLRLGI